MELLRGRFSRGVMEVLIRPHTGLFPSPGEISFECSCPDWAGMCKHVAATLYGVGARLDEQPELSFPLRHVDQTDLLTAVSGGAALAERAGAKRKRIADAALAHVFGIEIDEPTAAGVTPAAPTPLKETSARRRAGKARRSPAAPAEPARPAARRRRREVMLDPAKAAHRRQARGRADERGAGRWHQPRQPPPRG